MYHIRNATLYAPESMGQCDILVAGPIIAAVAPGLTLSLPGLETIDAKGLTVTPGFIDQHIHIIGGGGDEGPATRVPEVAVSQLAACGTTSVVGVCGFDSVTRSMEALLAKARALQKEGISAWMYSGTYALPPSLLTRSVRHDLFLVPEVLGIKIAYADRNSSFPTLDELLRLASDVRVGGLTAGKPGLLHIHVGGFPGAFTAFNAMIDRGIPAAHIRPTHSARTENAFKDALAFMKRGGVIDLTSGVGCFTSIADVLRLAKAEGADTANLTMSTDGNGRVPLYDVSGQLTGFGVGSINANLDAIRAMVRDGLPLEEALPLVTANVARHLGLSGKGRVAAGMDADLCFFDRDMSLRHVMARGRFLVRHGETIAKGMFE